MIRNTPVYQRRQFYPLGLKTFLDSLPLPLNRLAARKLRSLSRRLYVGAGSNTSKPKSLKGMDALHSWNSLKVFPFSKWFRKRRSLLTARPLTLRPMSAGARIPTKRSEAAAKKVLRSKKQTSQWRTFVLGLKSRFKAYDFWWSPPGGC